MTPERGARVDDVVIGGAFKLSGPSTVASVVALQLYLFASVLVTVAKPIDTEIS